MFKNKKKISLFFVEGVLMLMVIQFVLVWIILPIIMGITLRGQITDCNELKINEIRTNINSKINTIQLEQKNYMRPIYEYKKFEAQIYISVVETILIKITGCKI